MSAGGEKLARLMNSNPIAVVKGSCDILLKILDNVINNPGEAKYRTIRKENKTIKEKLLAVTGMNEVLLDIGFKANETVFVLPEDVSINRLKEYKQAIIHSFSITECFKRVSSTMLPSPASAQGVPARRVVAMTVRRSCTCSRLFSEKIRFPSVLNTSNKFLNMLENHSDIVMQYEDPILQKHGRNAIPYEKLQRRALKKLRNIQKAIQAKVYTDIEPSMRDLILVELVDWFNNTFFDWVDKIACKKCRVLKQMSSSAIENGVRVEILNCCGEQTKFFRYNDVAYLLRTRRGRCGEFANCFTFLCKCLGYDARYVHATFDHVWTEVYSDCQKRWLHIDPSENVVDAPLMYQHGWERNVDYVFGFATNDIQDVSWRYSSDHKKTLSSRKVCSESELLGAILKLREKRQKFVSDAQKQYLRKRNLQEILELMIEREPTENEKRGRSSGSLAWRLARGEGNYNNFFMFVLDSTEISAKQFNVRYSPIKDIYERYIIQGNEKKITETYSTWQACNYSCKNILRKVEKDWKMVYLARCEDTDDAELVWRFNFSDSGLTVKGYRIKFETKTYEDGNIRVKLITGLNSENIIGSSQFSLVVSMTGGKGDVAWQHTQLFRQSLNSNEFPFEFNIIFS